MLLDIFDFIISSFVDVVVAHGLAVIAIVVVAYIVRLLVRQFTGKMVRRLIVRREGMSKRDETQRENTLIRILNTSAGVTIFVISVIFILEEFGVPVGPLLTAAGIVGVALGFGAQHLVRDMISGLFIILENQYRIDDAVCLNGICGTVEDITFRKTTLRDLDGSVHHVAHGTIENVTNKSQGFSRIKVDVGVDYDSDLEYVREVIDRVGEDMMNDTVWSEKLIKAPKFLRVQSFGDSALNIRILGDTKPGAQWAVAGELRKRIVEAFRHADIVIPYPVQEVRVNKAKKDILVGEEE